MGIKPVPHRLNYKRGSSAPQHSMSSVLFVGCALDPETMTSLYKIEFRISMNEQRAEFKSSLLSLLQIFWAIKDRPLDLPGFQGHRLYRLCPLYCLGPKYWGEHLITMVFWE